METGIERWIHGYKATCFLLIEKSKLPPAHDMDIQFQSSDYILQSPVLEILLNIKIYVSRVWTIEFFDYCMLYFTNDVPCFAQGS